MAIQNTVDWELPEPTGEEAVLDPYAKSSVSVPISEEAAKKRAAKVSVAFAGEDNPPSYDEILADVSAQREDRLKDRLAASESIRKAGIKQDLVRQVVDSGDTTPESLAFLQSVSAEDITSKDGILEKKYAEWRVNLGLSSDESGTVDKALESEDVSGQVDSSVDRIYRKERAQVYYDEVDALYQQTGLGRTLLDFAADTLPWFTATEDRNITPDNVNVDGVMPGAVRRSQIRDLMAMPQAEYEATLAEMKQRAIDSGDYAPFLKLLRNLQDYSAYQGQVENAFAALSLVELAPSGLVWDAAKGGLSLSRAGVKTVATAEARRKATEAVAEAASKGGSPEVAKAAGEAPKASKKTMTEAEAAEAGLYNSPAVRVNGKVYETEPGRASDSTHLDGFDKAVVDQGQEAVDNGEVVVGWTDSKGTFVPDDQIEYPKGDRERAGKSIDSALDRPAAAPKAPVPGGRIEASTGSGSSLRHPTYKSYVDEIKASGISEEEVAKVTGIRNEADFLADREKEIQQYVEGPAQDALRRVYAKGGSPYSSNAYGPGDKGVWYTDKDGKEAFEPLTASVLTNKEVTLAAVAEKASGDPRPLEDIAAAVNEPLFLEEQMAAFEAKIADRPLSDYHRTGQVITGKYGEPYKITVLDSRTYQEMRGKNSVANIQQTDDPFKDPHKIYLNNDMILTWFDQKRWAGKDGKMPNGTRALPKDAFKTLDEFRAWVVEHEIAHISAEKTFPLGKDATPAQITELEDMVNKAALYRIGRRDLVKKVYPEDFGSVPEAKPVPAPPKVKDITRPTPQTIDVPGTQDKWQKLNAEIATLNKRIEETYPENVAKSRTKGSKTTDYGKLRAELQNKLAEAKEKLAQVKLIIDSKPYQLHVKGREELAKKISILGDQLAFPSKHYPKLKGKDWIKKSLSLKKELKELQDQWEQTDRLDINPRAETTPNTVQASDAVDRFGNKTPYSKTNPPKKAAPDWKDPEPYITVDIPNAATGGKAQVQIPATDENLAKVYIANVEGSVTRDMDDTAGTFAAHGDMERAAVAEAFNRASKKPFKDRIKDLSADLAAKLPSIMDPIGAVTGRPAHNDLKKLANKLADTVYKPIVERQQAIGSKLWDAFEKSQSMGALRWSDDVFEAVKDLAAAQTRKTIGSPNSAILNVKYLREWESTARTNQIVYQLGTPDGRLFVNPKQAQRYAQDIYGLKNNEYVIRSINPETHYVEVARVVNETDPNILNKAIQLDTKTPVSWTGAFLPYLRGAAGVSSETLRQNLRVSPHHAKALHEAFVTAAKDIGTLSKKEMRNLDALMAAKRDVEKKVLDPVSFEWKTVRGEWFNSAKELEDVYKKAFGEFPSDNVTSAYFTMRQMYDFDLLHRNLKLYTEKSRKGFVNAKLYLPWTDQDGNISWKQQKKGVEVKVLDEVPAGNLDVLVLDSDTFATHQFNTGKSGVEGIKALQEKGYKILQLVAPDQRPLKGTTTNYVNLVIAKDVDVTPLTIDQLPATEGGHIRYYDGFFVKQPRYEVTENGQKLYLGDRTVLSASSESEGIKRASAMEKARQLLKAQDFAGLKAHLESNLPWTVGQFEDLFKPRMSRTGEVVEPAQLDLDTPIVWVRDGQGTNDAAKTHAPELVTHFAGVRDTIDDPLNEMAMIGKKYTGEKDLTLHRVVEKDGVFSFENARMLSPLETLEQSWAEVARSMAADNLKIQASTSWVEEAADALLTPIEELRRNPWEALNNPQWNKQYGDIAKIRTLDAQRRQVIAFLGQKDQLGTTLDWMKNKLMNSVFESRGQSAADWVDDHLLPNVTNPLSFMRSFAFHTKMGFFNPIHLFLQMNTLVNTWAITGNIPRVGSALSGVMLMQMARINRTPQVLAELARKSEKLGWKPGEWAEMDSLFYKQSLHIFAGEYGAIDVMTNQKMFKGVGGMFLDKGLMFFREGERAVRMNAFAVAFKEFRDKFPTKVIDNIDENRIMDRMEVLAGMMNRGDNALWQKGLTGPMTQFWGYQARIMEQLLGKQLTRAEKLRLGTAFAAMYGMPVSLAATTMFQIPGWSTDDLRQYALENGIDVNSGPLSVAMNGIPAELIRWMTSDENGQGGILLGIGDRYGPGGLPVIKNLLDAKDGTLDALIDLAFGASGSITRDFFAHAFPKDWDVIDAAVNAPGMTLADYAGMFSTISTVNNTTKLYWALTTHQNMTRDGLDLGDKSAASAWISFVTGLEEQRFKDVFLKMDSLKDLKAANEELGKEYLREIRKAKLLPPGDERKRRIAKATALLSPLDPKDKKKYVSLGYKGSDGLEESINKNFKDKVTGN